VAEAFDIETSASFILRLRIATEIGDRLLAFAFEQGDAGERGRIIAEAKHLLGRYLFAG
jgi:hypothetical protein